MLCSNSLVDYWFDEEVNPYLTQLDYSQCQLTPELIKYKLLQNQAFCFKYNDDTHKDFLLIIGEIIFTDYKEFYIMYLCGKNIKKFYKNFIEEMKTCGVGRITGHNIDKINMLHARNLYGYPYKFENKIHYFIDLSKLNYSNFINDNAILEKLNNSLVDYWWYSIIEDTTLGDINTFKSKLLNNQLTCYKIDSCVIIGFMHIGIQCKQFVILWIQNVHKICNFAKFLHHLEMYEHCKYISVLYDRVTCMPFDNVVNNYNPDYNAIKTQNFSFLSLI